MNNNSFTDMDLHCIARLVQSSFQAPEQETINTLRGLYGCMYCKYAFECVHAVQQKGEPFHFQKILKKLEEMTGIRESYSPCTPDADEIGRRFFPGSYYIGHPEMVSELGKVHPERMMDGFKASLDRLITCSGEIQKTGQTFPENSVKKGHE